MDKKEVQKSLLKNKTMAFFDRFENGDLFYNVWVDGFDYQFPIPVMKEVHINTEVNDESGEPTGIVIRAKIHAPKPDVKGAAFVKEMRGSELFRWIAKAIDNNNFIQISQ